ncbi:MAG: 7,8-didemethyl-8-hydroxy-5-deazariboflavin synthase CofG [Candidatus Mycalebacterium zealandia]|nr:MAG: 7,8-didemethyl-8-hydroxy-5-deazariboflavin synthase CofG [Candidatus Mycalebacterium zealandia]
MGFECSENEIFDRSRLEFMARVAGLNASEIPTPDPQVARICEKAARGDGISPGNALFLAGIAEPQIPVLLSAASFLAVRSHGKELTYSKNVFVPLTRLCRNHCGYCTFKIEPGDAELFIPPDEVDEIARKGAELGCTELLFVLGDKPEAVYDEYRKELGGLGCSTTAEYLAEVCESAVGRGIFPHSNLGLATKEELSRLKQSNPSMGLMLENISPRLLKPGNAHHRCADKVPKLRMETMERAGNLRIPWTSGILVGIGETRAERVDSLFALKDLSDRLGHIQEIIIQNFSPKDGIAMEGFPPPDFADMLKTVAVARLVFGGGMNIQVPPNLNGETYANFIPAGINDLGGVSPLTIDYVNPEAPWPLLEEMSTQVSALGFELRERLPVYPQYMNTEFLEPQMLEMVKARVDERGLVPEAN